MMYDFDHIDEHVDRIIDLAKTIEPDKITILTGSNGGGKSLVRKLVAGNMQENHNLKMAGFSMERRTSQNHDFGALKSIHMDAPDDATSNHTCDMILRGILSNPDTENKFLVFDEPEIGVGKEILLGLMYAMQTKINERMNAGVWKGALVITHSEFFIQHFDHDVFLNIDGYKTFEQWRNRKVQAIAPETLEKWSLAMWRNIQKRIQKRAT